MSKAIPSLPAVTGDRALEVMGSVPVGCTAVYIGLDDDRHWPHLRPEEFAVVDTHDRDITFGELYLVRQCRGAVIWQVTRSDHPSGTCAMLRPLNNPAPRRLPNGTPDIAGCHFTDGPIRIAALEDVIIGRVVGVLIEPSVGRAA